MATNTVKVMVELEMSRELLDALESLALQNGMEGTGQLIHSLIMAAAEMARNVPKEQ